MERKKFFEGVESYRLMAKHEVGQNFLVDSDAAERIVSLLDIQEGERVLEIGSGAGSLTYFLAESKGQVEAIDIDEGLISKLQNDFKGAVDVHYGNGMKWDYAPYDKIIGNLPYYITSSLIERALLHGEAATRMVFMVQKEAGERLLSSVGSKEYGPLPILISLCCDAKRAFQVGRSSFVPPPHIESSVLVFQMKQRDFAEISKIYKLCNALFLQRRKTILNNLKNYLHDGEEAKAILSKTGIMESQRPESISPEQYRLLSQLIG